MRLIKHGRDHPFVIKLSEVPGLGNIVGDAEKVKKYELHLCACGLSKHKPFCDGSHMHTRDEEPGKVFAYDNDNNRIDITQETKELAEKLPDEY